MMADVMLELGVDNISHLAKAKVDELAFHAFHMRSGLVYGGRAAATSREEIRVVHARRKC